MGDRVIAKNRFAHLYQVEEKYVAGIALRGSEVKSIRLGKVSIDEAVVTFERGRPVISNMYIAPYQNSPFNPDPSRTRELLLTEREINKIFGKVTIRGYKAIPLAVIIRDNKLVKVEIGVGRKKKLWDKRREIMEKDQRRVERGKRIL